MHQMTEILAVWNGSRSGDLNKPQAVRKIQHDFPCSISRLLRIYHAPPPRPPAPKRLPARGSWAGGPGARGRSISRIDGFSWGPCGLHENAQARVCASSTKAERQGFRSRNRSGISSYIWKSVCLIQLLLDSPELLQRALQALHNLPRQDCRIWQVV